MWHHLAMGRLLLLFVALPAVELALLIELGSRFGTLHTIGLIVVTGVVGASLARGQGISVVRAIQREVAEGRLPADSMVDGVMILIAAALLVTPGVLTDTFGFVCLVPSFRKVVRASLWKYLEVAVRENRIQVDFQGGFPGQPTQGGPEERVVFDVDDPRGRPPGADG
jgi:UPF0716 protein FxsA